MDLNAVERLGLSVDLSLDLAESNTYINHPLYCDRDIDSSNKYNSKFEDNYSSNFWTYILNIIIISHLFLLVQYVDEPLQTWATFGADASWSKKTIQGN